MWGKNEEESICVCRRRKEVCVGGKERWEKKKTRKKVLKCNENIQLRELGKKGIGK